MTDLAQKTDLAAEQYRRGPVADFFYRLVREKPLGLLGAVIITLFVLVSVFADYLAPDPELEQDVTRRLQGSSIEHPLGTDHIGRDFLSRNIYGARQLLLVGFTATAVAVLVATAIGGLSGFIGDRFDMVTQRFVDAWLAFPGLLLLMTVMSIVDRGAADHHRAGSRLWDRQLARDPVRGDRHQGERLLRGREGRRQSWLAHYAAPRAAERDRPHYHHFQHHHWHRHHHRGVAELPGFWAALGRSRLGRTVEPRRAPVHAGGAVAGDVAGDLPDHRGLLPQHVWRCHAGPARSATSWW